MLNLPPMRGLQHRDGANLFELHAILTSAGEVGWLDLGPKRCSATCCCPVGHMRLVPAQACDFECKTAGPMVGNDG